MDDQQRVQPPVGWSCDSDGGVWPEYGQVGMGDVETRKGGGGPREVGGSLVVVNGAFSGVVGKVRHVRRDVPMHVLHVVSVLRPRVNMFGRQFQPAQKTADGNPGRKTMDESPGTHE